MELEGQCPTLNCKKRINPLRGRDFSIRGLHWHEPRDRVGMSILIVLFPFFGSLLCVLVSADYQASKAIEAVRVRKTDLS